MRHLVRSALVLLLASVSAQAQQYTISTIAGRGQPLYYASALDAAIQPWGVAVDTAGAVYFSSGNAVYRLELSGALARIAGGYAAGCSGDGGLAINAQLNHPAGIAVDATGAVYIADAANSRIRKVSPGGIITTSVGNTVPDCGPSGVPTIYVPLGAPAAVAVDSRGAIYVGDSSNSSVSKVSNGVVTTLISKLDGVSGLSVDAAGNVYIAGNDILKLTPNGVVSTVFRPSPTISVAVDTVGNVYVADLYSVMKISTVGVVSTVLYEGGRAGGVGGVAVDAAGDLYVATRGSVRRLSADGVLSTVAGNFTLSFSGDGGPATDALFGYCCENIRYPGEGIGSIALDAAGSLYVADSFNSRVRKIASDGTITTVAGGGTLPYPDEGDGGQATNALVGPLGLAPDSQGNLYIGEFADIRRVGLDGVITTFVQGIAARDLAFGPDGSLYASGATVNRILPSGAVVPVAGNNWPASCADTPCLGTPPPPLGDGGPATLATIFPGGVAVDSASNLYIADGQNRIREVTSSTGIITTFAGTGSEGYSGDGGPATDAQLNLPTSLVFDTTGNLYIADTGNYTIRKVSRDGTITTIAGSESSGHSGDGGPALDAQFIWPGSLAIDAAGNVYVSDYDSIRLLKPCAPAASASTPPR
jgi:sugar lactone lactonase YvrE